MKEVVSNNKELVNFFTKAHYWMEWLESWRVTEKVGDGIKTFFETQWFSFAKVCLSVQSHELGFRKCVETSIDRSTDAPAIKKSIRDIVYNRLHFASNDLLVRVLQPVVDTISKLEQAHATVGEVWSKVIVLYMKLKEIKVEAQYSTAQSHCIQIFKK